MNEKAEVERLIKAHERVQKIEDRWRMVLVFWWIILPWSLAICCG